jgi:hypothetical protein
VNKYLIDVTQEDIDVGVRYQCDKCPLSRAMSRALCESKIMVGAYTFSIGLGVDFVLPDIAVHWRRAFDEGKVMDPISFELQLVEFV